MNTKKSKLNNYFYTIIFIFLILIFLFTNIIKIINLDAPGVFDSDKGEMLNINFEIYENGQFLDKTKLPYEFTSSTKNKDIELIAKLPNDKAINNSFLLFRASGFSVRIAVDNKEIYSFFDKDAKDYGGGYRHFIRLPENSNSKQLSIKLFCPSDNPFSQKLFPIYIGTKGYLLYQAFELNYNSLFFGIILIILGFIFIGNLLFFNWSRDNSFLLSLSLLLLCLGTWVLTQSSSRQLIGISNPALPMELSFFSMVSLPFCLWFYTSTNYPKISNYKIIKWFSIIILFLYIPISIGSLFNISYLKFLVFMGSLLLFFTLLILFVSIKIYKNGEKKIISCILAISSILISIIAEEILLILKISIGHVSLLHLGMAITAFIFINNSLGNLIEKNNKDNEAKLLKKLAYLDVVTLVENRNSYERYLELKGDNLDNLGIILADINGLKIINDTYGHKYGDELLKRLSKALKESLPEGSKLYRIGGDEFIGLIYNKTKEEFYNTANSISQNFSPTEKDSGMAIGAHYYIKELDLNIKKAIEKADSNMYKHKEKQKPLINKKYLKNGVSQKLVVVKNK